MLFVSRATRLHQTLPPHLSNAHHTRYLRKATAEFNLVAAVKKWEEQKADDAKWNLSKKQRGSGKVVAFLGGSLPCSYCYMCVRVV